jgi:hypothetical protein
MTDPNPLPAGSCYQGSREYTEYRIDLYTRPDELRQAVVRPKLFTRGGKPNLFDLDARMPAFSREVFGDKMYHVFSVEV